MLLAAADSREIRSLLVGHRSGDTHVDQLRVAADRVQRRAQLVAHRREELGFRATRRFHGGETTRVPYGPLLRLFSLREIPRHLRESDELTLWIEQGRDDGVRPETRPVFTNAPAFVLEAAFARRYLQLPRRFATFDVLFWIERGEMATDDFVRFIPFDSPRAFIPRRDVSCRVEHEDGVVLHALDDQPVPLLALPQFLL